MKKSVIIAGIVVALSLSFSSYKVLSDKQEANNNAIVAESMEQEAIDTTFSGSASTQKVPTSTPIPTDTPIPTQIPLPTATPTPDLVEIKSDFISINAPCKREAADEINKLLSKLGEQKEKSKNCTDKKEEEKKKCYEQCGVPYPPSLPIFNDNDGNPGNCLRECPHIEIPECQNLGSFGEKNIMNDKLAVLIMKNCVNK
jgi:hypothetical protein